MPIQPGSFDPYAEAPQHLPDTVGYDLKCCGWKMRCASSHTIWPDGKEAEQSRVAQTTENSYTCDRCGNELTLKWVERTSQSGFMSAARGLSFVKRETAGSPTTDFDRAQSAKA